MKFIPRDHRQSAVIDTCHPWRDWGFVALGVVCLVALLAFAAALDLADEGDQAIAASVDFAAGIEEGRRLERLAHVTTLRAAYQHGLDEAFIRCTADPKAAAAHAHLVARRGQP